MTKSKDPINLNVNAAALSQLIEENAVIQTWSSQLYKVWDRLFDPGTSSFGLTAALIEYNRLCRGLKKKSKCPTIKSRLDFSVWRSSA